MLPIVSFPGQIHMKVLYSAGEGVSPPRAGCQSSLLQESQREDIEMESAPAFLPEGLSREWKSVILPPLSGANALPTPHHRSYLKPTVTGAALWLEGAHMPSKQQEAHHVPGCPLRNTIYVGTLWRSP